MYSCQLIFVFIDQRLLILTIDQIIYLIIYFIVQKCIKLNIIEKRHLVNKSRYQGRVNSSDCSLFTSSTDN